MFYYVQACKLPWDDEGEIRPNFALWRTAAAGLNKAKVVKLTLDKVRLLKLSQTATLQVTVTGKTVPLQAGGGQPPSATYIYIGVDGWTESDPCQASVYVTRTLLNVFFVWRKIFRISVLIYFQYDLWFDKWHSVYNRVIVEVSLPRLHTSFLSFLLFYC